MSETVLITGGGGFIGRHVVAELLSRGNRVRVLDAMLPQVHAGAERPAGLSADAEFIRADLCDRDALGRALRGVDAIVHLAAEVGVGQSMYEVERYTAANDLATAILFETLITHPVRRVVTASSMSIYGEGLYLDSSGMLVETVSRSAQRRGQDWDPVDERGNPLVPVPTPEWKRPALASIYALNKFVQERITHIMGQPYGIETVCLRLFNVFGPGQSLSNPYTGVLAIFASRLLNGQRPLIFEDGRQRRDFVHVSDVARAFADALVSPQVVGKSINIGSGVDRSILDITRALGIAMGCSDVEPEILGKGRVGDIRHCFCDTGLASDLLGYRPRKDFAQGLTELAQWVETQIAEDRVSEARAELETRGLVA